MDLLPHDVLLHIFCGLPPSSLCSLALTCHHLYTSATDPSLWSKAKLNKMNSNATRLSSLFQTHRFSRLSCIDLSYMEVTTEQITGFLESSLATTNLNQLNLTGINLLNVEAELLALATSRLRTLDLGSSCLDQRQIFVLLSHMVTSTTLTHVDLSSVNFDFVDPTELLAQAVLNLTKLNLASSRFSTDQLISLFTHIKHSKTLKDVDLGNVDLRDVPKHELSEGVVGLVKINLEKTGLDEYQCTSILESILHSTTMEEVNLGEIQLSLVSADLLSMAIAKLVKANLRKTWLTRPQFAKLMTHSLTSTTLEDINVFSFEGKCKARLPIPETIIAKAVSRLKTVNLGCADLTSLHVTAIFKEIKSSKSLMHLKLQEVNLSRVPPDIFSDGVCLLKSVDLNLTKITPQQLTTLFTAIVSCKNSTQSSNTQHPKSTNTENSLSYPSPSMRLKEINLKNTNIWQVCPDLLGRAMAKMINVNLAKSKLTTKHLMAVLNQAINTQTLEQIDLVGNNMSEVPPVLLKKALQTTNIFYS